MALTELYYTFHSEVPDQPVKEWSHTGVVGSGDLEIMIEKKDLKNQVSFKIVTPVKGYGQVWEKVLEKFVSGEKMAGLSVEINDNNATPFVVAMRLKQAMEEAKGGIAHD